MQRQGAPLASQSELLQQIKSLIVQAEPTAAIYLFGSRARNEAASDSDWDLLIILDGHVDAERKRRVRHRLYALEREAEEVLSAIVVSGEEWNAPRFQVSPFYQNVMNEGIPL